MPSLLEAKDLQTYFFGDEGTVKAVDGVSYGVNEGWERAEAGHDLHGAGVQSQARHCRRAHHGPGCDDPGPAFGATEEPDEGFQHSPDHHPHKLGVVAR